MDTFLELYDVKSYISRKTDFQGDIAHMHWENEFEQGVIFYDDAGKLLFSSIKDDLIFCLESIDPCEVHKSSYLKSSFEKVNKENLFFFEKKYKYFHERFLLSYSEEQETCIYMGFCKNYTLICIGTDKSGEVWKTAKIENTEASKEDFYIITPVVDQNALGTLLQGLRDLFFDAEAVEINLGYAAKCENTSFYEALLCAKRNMYLDRMNRKYIYLSEFSMDNKIDSVRSDLNHMLENSECYVINDEIVALSQFLDELIVTYVKNNKNNQRE